jgi:pyruvate,water dikinase
MRQNGFSDKIPPFMILSSRMISQIAEKNVLPLDIKDRIIESLSELNSTQYFVRSAAAIEDELGYPTAGLFTSYGNVTDLHLESTILKCIRDAQNQKIETILGSFPPLCIFIQAQINAMKSGILFTKDPVGNDTSQIIIEAGFGMGEGVVRGQYPVDQYRVQKSEVIFNENNDIDEKLIRSFVPLKTHYIEAQGGKIKPLSPGQQSIPVLSTQQIQALCLISSQIEAKYKAPIDIEWAFDSNHALWILQLRDAQ